MNSKFVKLAVGVMALLMMFAGMANASGRFTTSWITTWGCIYIEGVPVPFILWQESVPEADDVAHGFENSLDDVATFEWTRSNAQVEEEMFESPNATYWVGDYDIHYHVGHGNYGGPAMWAFNERANLENIEVGPELEWLAMCSCLVVGQADPWPKYENSFENGLHGAMGGYGYIYVSGDEGDHFADNLKDSDTIKTAWLDAHDDDGGSPGIIYNGTSLANCWTRIDNEQYWGEGTVYSDPNPGNSWCRYHRN